MGTLNSSHRQLADSTWHRAWRGHVLRAKTGVVLARIIRLPLPVTAKHEGLLETGNEALAGLARTTTGYAWATLAAHGVERTLRAARSRAVSAVRTGLIQPDLFIEPEHRGLPVHAVLLQWATTEETFAEDAA